MIFFKSGTKTKLEKYRPISLTPVPGKLLERLIRDILVKHMKENNLFSKAHHGFVTGRSCSTRLLQLMEETLYTNGGVYIIYLDFKKPPVALAVVGF